MIEVNTGKMLFLRAIVAFMAMPAVVAGVVPVVWMRGTPVAHSRVVPGGALLAVGGGLLIWCVRDFFVSGRGTLAPWDPPKRLVIVGLYRFTRNPMYLAVLTIIVGWSALFASAGLALYAIAVAVAFYFRVRWYEEPWLQRQFGADWEDYARRTPRWFPRLRNRKSRNFGK